VEFCSENLSEGGLERSKITRVNTNKIDFYKTYNARDQKSEKFQIHKFCLVYVLSLLFGGWVYLVCWPLQNSCN
jgi:hypothetical protein